MKTCEDCGCEYDTDLCPDCEREKYWQKLYKLVDDLYSIYDRNDGVFKLMGLNNQDNE